MFDFVTFGLLAAIVALLVALSLPDIRRLWRRSVGASPTVLGRLAVALAIAGFVLAPVIAFAQDAGAAAGAGAGSSWPGYIVSIVVAAFLAFVAWVLHRYLGITLDRQAQDSLHRAMMTGATMVAARLGMRSAGLDAAAPEMVLDYVRKSVPDALDRLSPGQDVLAGLAAAKLNEVASASGTVVPKFSGL